MSKKYEWSKMNVERDRSFFQRMWTQKMNVNYNASVLLVKLSNTVSCHRFIIQINSWLSFNKNSINGRFFLSKKSVFVIRSLETAKKWFDILTTFIIIYNLYYKYNYYFNYFINGFYYLLKWCIDAKIENLKTKGCHFRRVN